MAYAEIFLKDPPSFHVCDITDTIIAATSTFTHIVFDSPEATIRIKFHEGESTDLYQKLLTIHTTRAIRGG